jgi:hypothetical protein
MIAKFTADLLVVVHFAFILFVIFGGLLVLKWWKVSILHIPSVLWGALIEFRGWICPLTPLEHHFREAAGGAGYTGGFIDHYLISIIYPEGLTQGIQIVLGVIVLAINLCVYGVVLFRGVNRE